MGKLVLSNAAVLVGAYDHSGDVNAVAAAYGADVVDFTTMGNASRRKLPGLKDFSATVEGFVDLADEDIDEQFFNQIGQANVPITISPEQGGAEGERCFFGNAVFASYAPGAAIGEALRFSVSAEGDDDLVRGEIIANRTETATGSGPGVNLGAVAAGQRVFAAAHVLAASGTGPQLDLEIVSDDANTFLSETSRITFSQFTGIGSALLTATGPITDDWWRVNFTIAGTGPSFTFAVALGIL